MNLVVVNGLGCPRTGGKVVFSEIWKELSAHQCTLGLLSDEAMDIVRPQDMYRTFPSRICLGFMRLAVEFGMGIGLFGTLMYPQVNLSNYGFMIGQPCWLMIHSPNILEPGHAHATVGAWCKNVLLLWSLTQVRGVLLQSSHMDAALSSYCRRTGMRLPPIYRIRPKVRAQVEVRQVSDSKRLSLFYPASPFPHKRVDLCEAVWAKYGGDSAILFTVTSTKFSGPGFTGLGLIPRAEVVTRYRTCDALLFTSERETLGLPLLEAISLGLPAILPRLPYAVDVYGDAGCYFDEFTADSIWRAISDFRNNRAAYQQKVLERLDVVVRAGEGGGAALQQALNLERGLVI